MKKVIDLARYQLNIYVRGTKFVMPLVAIMLFLYLMYSIMPVGIVSSALLSCNFLFILMVWIGLTVSSSENPVMEQILLLRVQSSRSYYLSKVVFILLIGVLVTAICVVFPILQNVLNHNQLFIRRLTGFDVIHVFCLEIGCAFAGGALGSLLHPRVMKNRKTAIVLTAFLAILTVVKTAVTEEIPLSGFVLWVLPPVADVSKLYARADYFQWNDTSMTFFALMLSGILIQTGKSVLCNKNKF